MARDISSAFTDEINAKLLRPAFFIKAEFDSGDVRVWTGIGEKTYDSETYQGLGNFLSMSAIQESQDLQANGVQFNLSGVPSSYISIALAEDYQWRPISMWFAVLDTDKSIIADPYLVFQGKMDVLEIVDNGEESSLVMYAENDLIILTRDKERRYTPEDQKKDYPSDKGFDFVPLIQDVEITWGSSDNG